MKKIIVTMIILLSVLFTNNIEAYNNTNNYLNDLKFIGYSSIKKSIILEDNEKINLVINDKYKVYELFIPLLEDFSIVCTSKKELFNYYNSYKENKNKKGINKIEYNNNYYDIYFNFLGGKYYRIEKEYFSNLMITYINNIDNNTINNESFFYCE